MRLLHAIVALGACALAGCIPSGGSASGDLGNAVGVGSADYALLDLQTRSTTYAAALPDLATNPAYRDRYVVFRRVGPEGARFLIGVFELTQAQWVRLDGSQPWQNIPDGVNHTVDGGADWTGKVVVKSSAQTGDRPAYGLDYGTVATALAAFPLAGGSHLALPTSSQWTTAAGAASGYVWGQDVDRASVRANAVVAESALSESNKLDRLAGGIDVGGPETVGTRAPSQSGLYDLHGNVWEWTDPGSAVRGGSWYDTVSLSRIEVTASAGQGLASDVDHALIGARLVLVP